MVEQLTPSILATWGGAKLEDERASFGSQVSMDFLLTGIPPAGCPFQADSLFPGDREDQILRIVCTGGLWQQA